MKKLNKKSGISFIILVLTIVVALILLASAYGVTSNVMNNGVITNFTEDLLMVQDQATLYYTMNGTIPKYDDTDKETASNVLSMVDTKYRAKLQEEMELNKDTQNDFYKIDLSKLDIDRSSRGFSNSGNVSDVFLLAYPTFNVYYLKGASVGDEIYFSLSTRLTSIARLPNDLKEQIDYVISTKTSHQINVTKNEEDWYNKMNISISTYVDTNETLYMSISDGELKQITPVTQNTTNRYYFDSLEDILNGKTNIKVTNLTKEEVENFSNLEKDKKYIEIVKRQSGVEISRIKINLSGYDNTAPTRISEPLVTSVGENKNISFKIKDDGVGIYKVKYDFLVFQEDGKTTQDYYSNIKSFDIDYLSVNGKEANLNNDGVVELQVPKSIKKMAFVLIDHLQNARYFEVQI